MRWGRLAIAGALLLAAAGFGIQPASAANSAVAIQGVAFMPDVVTVHPGDTVVWTHNDGSTPHSVTSDGGSAETFDSSPTCPASGCMMQGSVFMHTFNSVGSFAYHCHVHSTMHGTVKVELVTTTTAKPTTTTAKPTTTVKQTTTTSSRATTTSNTQTTETIALDTTSSSESTTSTTAGQVAIKSKGGTSGAGIALLVVAIAAVLGGGGYAIYRLRSGRF